MPCLQFIAVEGVVETLQRDAVLHAAESLRRLPPHALGGAVGADQLRLVLLKFGQFPVETVIDRVFHHRCVEHVVSVGSSVEQEPEFGGSPLHIRH